MPMCIAPNNAALLINAAIIAPATTQRSVWKDSVPVRIYAFHTEAYSSGSEFAHLEVRRLTVAGRSHPPKAHTIHRQKLDTDKS
eukprot:scaffold82153_cov63-Cyclotella_meneghiniana.AAC.1